MQKLISKYGLAAHLALVAVAPLFLSPIAVIWLSVLGAVWVVMEPSRIGNELIHEARRRVARAIFRDPVFWVSFVLVIIAVFRNLNVGISMAYDAEAGKWGVADPSFPLLPGSVEGTCFPLIGCAVAAFVVIQGCRHCLGRSARGAFVLISSALSGVGAYVLAYLFSEGSKSVQTAVECPMTEMAFSGCTYGIFFMLATVALVAAFEARWLKAMPLAVIGLSGNAIGLFAFSPVTVAAAYVAGALLILIYSFVYLRIRLGRTVEFKFLVFVGIAMALTVLAVVGFFPKNFFNARTEPLFSGVFAPKGYVESRAVLSDISSRIWKSSPWLGYGYGSFPVLLQFNATSVDWEVVDSLQKAVPNGYWMLLVERGVVGAFFLAAPMVLLLITYFRRLVKGVRLSLPHPLAWTAIPVLIVAALEMLLDVSFLTPGPAVALVAVLSISAAAFPKEMSSNG